MTMDSANKNKMTRRKFVATSGVAVAGTMLTSSSTGFLLNQPGSTKKKVALVGTGIRGTSLWGKYLQKNYGDYIEFTGLCDINSGRLAFAKEYIGVTCPTFTNFDEMLKKAKIDVLMVTTVDATHHEFIIKALQHGMDVISEKPMTTDEVKCQAILDAERKSKNKVITAFNYRYGILPTEVKKHLLSNEIGKVTSVDFHWYLNTYHGASYFRRWHGIKSKGGTLLLHKASHHFDLLNWWIGSDPVEVHAYGDLEFYGKNHSFRGGRCMNCEHKDKCKFFWDITKDEKCMNLYVNNEQYDGYIRDNCLWRKEIDIYDKMAVQIKYANNVQVSYSLTAYSPFEGFRIAFNGMEGRLETWEGIPWLEKEQENQAEIYEKEMTQSSHTTDNKKFHEITVQNIFNEYKQHKLKYIRSGHWGGDKIMQDYIFKDIKTDAALNHLAGTRDGAMAILIGIAARKSIDEKRIIKISELTDLVPRENKWKS